MHFHKWGKWSVTEEGWVSINKRTGTEKEFAKWSQSRECLVCGKTQKEYLP